MEQTPFLILSFAFFFLVGVWVGTQDRKRPIAFDKATYYKEPLYLRPWETVPEYHIRIGKLRGDPEEYVQKMIDMYYSKNLPDTNK